MQPRTPSRDSLTNTKGAELKDGGHRQVVSVTHPLGLVQPERSDSLLPIWNGLGYQRYLLR